jgi:hypothetical protein
MKGWHYATIGFLLGCIVCGGAIYLVSRGAGAKLNADLAAVRTSLAKSTADNTELASELRQLHGELDIANGIVARDSQELTRRQRIIDSQQRDIGSLERGLAGIAEEIAGSGDDIRKQIGAIADGFGRLYAIYHPGASAR